ncbi:hypothetical protein PILCRDRAFT_3692 [Piloderma croceum F 1598]|uniref:Retrotransposon gag domain-containing protein n=1 Tax=Piloderma croceum (strain F 1598) TaxID=765440 RepID=A0A0C3FUB8_PILCF|nr:hypothetical protein PILCRDRAFT_3692 [Piloderma croceum F 1598]
MSFHFFEIVDEAPSCRANNSPHIPRCTVQKKVTLPTLLPNLSRPSVPVSSSLRRSKRQAGSSQHPTAIVPAAAPIVPPIAPPPPPLPPSPPSSPSTNSSDYHRPRTVKMSLSSNSGLAKVEQDSPNKVPVLLQGDLTPSVMRQYENACLGFFEGKEIAPEKQVRKILTGLRDDRIQEWISIDRDEILGLTFAEFMVEFKAGFLPEDWEEITRIELLTMQQGSGSFWDFSVKVQSKNALLRDTESFLDKDQLRHRIESGMTPKLTLRCPHEKSNKITDFKKWLVDVRRIDDLMRSDHAKLKVLQKAQREGTRCSNALAEPSRNSNATASSSSSSFPDKLARLTETERRLLFDNKGCLKCRKVFISHHSTNCPDGFPNAANYKTLTQSFVDYIKMRRNKKPVAAIMQPTDDNSTSLSTAPVAAIMGSSSSAIAYMPSNDNNVLEGDDADSDDTVSPLFTTPPVTNYVAASVPMARQDDIAPISVPHFFWRCAVSGAPGSFPMILNALIDHGSHIVLISNDLVIELLLKRRKLVKPMPVELAMPDQNSIRTLELSEYVKLKLYDPVGNWTSKTVRALIAPSLCAPVILGLPFLAHNNIVIDHALRTAVDKVSGFDLLHPTPPATPKPP